MENMQKIGYFIEDEIYWQGQKQPARKTEIISIQDDGKNTIQVLSDTGNWYEIERTKITLYNK